MHRLCFCLDEIKEIQAGIVMMTFRRLVVAGDKEYGDPTYIPEVIQLSAHDAGDRFGRAGVEQKDFELALGILRERPKPYCLSIVREEQFVVVKVEAEDGACMASLSYDPLSATKIAMRLMGIAGVKRIELGSRSSKVEMEIPHEAEETVAPSESHASLCARGLHVFHHGWRPNLHDETKQIRGCAVCGRTEYRPDADDPWIISREYCGLTSEKP